MLAAWTELLPVFVVRMLARKHCGTLTQGRIVVHEARPGVLIVAKATTAPQQARGG